MARQTLREVREAVSGYRQPTLAGELDGAWQMLEAAGVACQVKHTTGVLPPTSDTLLAWAVREGVTNVIRHSRAQLCSIQVTCENGTICAEIINDGYQEQKSTLAKTGSGLSGLAERIVACGGQVVAGPLLSFGKAGFRLRVELPMQNSVGTSREG